MNQVVNMKLQYLKLPFTLILILIFCQPLTAKQKIYQNEHAITYAPHMGRFGDHICGYSKTKWLSYKYKIPFLFNPFVPGHPETLDLFKQLTIFKAETHASKELIELIRKREYGKTVNPYLRMFIVEKESDLSAALKKTDMPTLFICSLGTQLDLTYETKFKKCINKYIWDIDLQLYLISLEKPFSSELKKMLTPITPITQKMPTDQVTVAVHIRTGEGYDYKKDPDFIQYYDNKKNFTKYNLIQINDQKNKVMFFGNKEILISYPENKEKEQNALNKRKLSMLRFLPKQYYVDQIIKLSELLNNKNLFVYIFTDAKDKFALINEIKSKVNLPNITWGYELPNSTNSSNIIEDFDAMSQFDCLIRPHSNFSIAASILGSHKIIISPANARWVDEKLLLINEVNIVMHNNK